jgi:plastocyanin
MRTLPHHTIDHRCCGKGALLLAAVLSATVVPLQAVAAPVTHTVTIEAMQFSPQITTVQVGDTVEWINKDPFPHNATSTVRQFKSNVMPPNARWTFVARHKGTFTYFCTLHPMMKASVIVK